MKFFQLSIVIIAFFQPFFCVSSEITERPKPIKFRLRDADLHAENIKQVRAVAASIDTFIQPYCSINNKPYIYQFPDTSNDTQISEVEFHALLGKPQTLPVHVFENIKKHLQQELKAKHPNHSVLKNITLEPALKDSQKQELIDKRAQECDALERENCELRKILLEQDQALIEGKKAAAEKKKALENLREQVEQLKTKKTTTSQDRPTKTAQPNQQHIPSLKQKPIVQSKNPQNISEKATNKNQVVAQNKHPFTLSKNRVRALQSLQRTYEVRTKLELCGKLHDVCEKIYDGEQYNDSLSGPYLDTNDPVLYGSINPYWSFKFDNHMGHLDFLPIPFYQLIEPLQHSSSESENEAGANSTENSSNKSSATSKNDSTEEDSTESSSTIVSSFS